MKNIIYNPFLLLSILIVTIICSCQKGPQFRKFNYPPQTPSGISPEIGYPGSYVTINGKGFDTLAGAVKVWFGGVQADSIISCQDNQIVVKVPSGAATGKVSLQIWTNQNDSIGNFTVVPAPTFSTISTTRANAGDIVTITGSHLGTDPGAVKLMIGSTQAEIQSISDNQIKFKVPDAPSGKLVLIYGTFNVQGPDFFIGDIKLAGRLIGHEGSWSNNPATTIKAAVDSNLSTYVDAATASGYVGYDFGKGKGAHITMVRFAPRATYASRMVGGEIRGANDPTLNDAVTLYKIADAPKEGDYTSVNINSFSSYRYVYYYASTGNCDIAEIEFYGQIESNPLPVGQLQYEFDIDGDNEGWTPQQGGTWSVGDGALNVTFTQSTGKKRADLAQTINGSNGNVTVQTGDYPIIAIKFNKQATCNITFDTNLGSVGNGSNKYKTDLEGSDVYYWDLSTQTFGTTMHTNEQIDLKTFQFKIADIPQDDPATGYGVQWIRSFKNVDDLKSFIKQ